ncbi:coiled-coil domain-containing protein 93 isoform X2 [Halyomorpha halys]|uniref:coiled-coil domain-containing protein 93 isoform X2 n=1 Tax=Halyomorpha halys TaxID=286706 RepID=UPI0006D4E9BE|nr:coiled-coil domain-containing protein 93 isoform X2 [Halyomorpha halys]
MSLSDALKPKGSKHLSRIINSEGVEVEAEKREDEQQKIKYGEIIECLIGAGYYRAKIKGISEFDKVVGGMTWCIDVCNIDLDVDLLFQENSTIGQKIALTEKIVTALQKMNCPFMIEPHQIQGLDFIHIYPVIEWLVKKSIENREERGDYLQQYAIHRFNNEFCFPGEKPNENFIRRALPHISAVQNKYSVQRKFRRIEGSHAPSDLMSRIQSTLFEYGHAPLQEKEEEENGDIKHVEAIDEVKLAPKAIKEIISLKSEELIDATKNYISLSADSEVSEKAEIVRLKEKEEALIAKQSEIDFNLKEAIEKLNKIKSRTSSIEESESRLSKEELKIVEDIKTRLMMLERLNEQEKEFKEYCKGEKLRLETTIREVDDYEGLNHNSIDEQLSSLEAQLANARISLAKVSRTEAKLHRLIDQVPSRPELNQYQRRFIELYNQVSAKYKETKQYYTLYNSMSDQHEYLNKEIKLLDSILEGYNATVNGSQHAKEEFINKFETLVDGIKQNKAKVETKRNEERDAKDRLRSQLFSMIEQQRQYASLLKQFREECEVNETLLTRMKAAAQVSASPEHIRSS